LVSLGVFRVTASGNAQNLAPDQVGYVQLIQRNGCA
jgi:hypothetical protein